MGGVAAAIALAMPAEAATQTAMLKAHVRLNTSCSARLSSPLHGPGMDISMAVAAANSSVTVTCSRGVKFVLFFDNGQGQIAMATIPSPGPSYTVALAEYFHPPQNGDETASLDSVNPARPASGPHHTHPCITISY